MSKNNDINLFNVRERDRSSRDKVSLERKNRFVHRRLKVSNVLNKTIEFDSSRFFSAADLVFRVILCVFAIGLFSVLLGNNFSFSDLAHNVLSSNLEPYNFNDWLTSIHNALPSNPVGTVLADIVILPSTIIYVLGFALNLLIALF